MLKIYATVFVGDFDSRHIQTPCRGIHRKLKKKSMIFIPPAPLLLPVNDVVRPSEHEPSDEADDRQADYAIENSPKAEWGGGLD